MGLGIESRRRILIRGVNWVGDAIMATPAIRALRLNYPDSKITLMVRPGVKAVYEHSPDLDDLWVEDDSASARAFARAVRRVRSGDFDLGIAFPNSLRSALLLALGGVRHRVGHARGGRRALFTRPIAVTPELLDEHEVFYYMNLVRWMLDGPPKPPQLVMEAGAAEREYVDDLLRDLDCPAGQPLFAVAPGSVNSRAKRWLPERFAETADRIVREFGAMVFLIGGESEKGVLDLVASAAGHGVINLGGRMSLGQSVALMHRMHGFVGNDSGAAHMAAAAGVPGATIFGPTRSATTAPFSAVARVVRVPVECSPCMLRDCPIDHPCMTGVTVGRVMGVLEEMRPEIEARAAASHGAGTRREEPR